MKYLLLCCHEEKKLDSMSKSECVAVMEETMAYCEALKKSGHLIAVEQLEPVQTAMTVRARNGKLSVTDGPFAETKEQVGGFFSDRCPRHQRDYPGRLEVSIRAVRQPGSAAGQGDVRSRSCVRHVSRLWR